MPHNPPPPIDSSDLPTIALGGFLGGLASGLALPAFVGSAIAGPIVATGAVVGVLAVTSVVATANVINGMTAGESNREWFARTHVVKPLPLPREMYPDKYRRPKGFLSAAEYYALLFGKEYDYFKDPYYRPKPQRPKVPKAKKLRGPKSRRVIYIKRNPESERFKTFGDN